MQMKKAENLFEGGGSWDLQQILQFEQLAHVLSLYSLIVLYR